MLYFDGVFGLFMLGLWLFCLFDVITTDSLLCRNLPKLVWVLLVLLLPDIGSIAWLIAGRTWASSGTSSLPYKGNSGRARSYGAPAPRRPSNPDDDEDFLRQVKERAERQRRDYRTQQQIREQGEPPEDQIR